jgi:hypothetical protein
MEEGNTRRQASAHAIETVQASFRALRPLEGEPVNQRLYSIWALFIGIRGVRIHSSYTPIRPKGITISRNDTFEIVIEWAK